jgi:hypothetical protein
MRLRSAVWLLLLASAVSAQQAVPRVRFDNPVAGFSLTIPEDWVMASGPAGNVEIAIDAAGGASLALQPALWFFSAPQPPEQEAQGLASALALLGNGAKPQVTAGGTPGGFEVTMTSTGARGALKERWLCRSERGRSYVIGAMGRPEVYDRHADDVTTALQTCHLIPTPVLTAFREPTENAYRMTLPGNWQWTGRIFRSETVPGYFEWRCGDPSGLAGAFSAPPVVFNIQTPYRPAGQAAGAFLLPALRQQIPDLQVERVHELPRAGAVFCAVIRALGIGGNPRVDRALVDCVGTDKGKRLRMRLEVVTLMLDASAVLGGRGNWSLMTNGVWGPADDFEAYYALGRGVIASLKTDPRWRANQLNAVNDLLNNRNSVMARYSTDWDALIRDSEPIPDPNTGERKEVPLGDGDPWFDKDGKAHRVPPDQEQEARDQGWDRVKK